MIVVSISLGTFRLMPVVVELEMTDGVVVDIVVVVVVVVVGGLDDKSPIPLLGTIPNSAA